MTDHTEMQIPDDVMEAATRALGEWTIDDGSHYQFHMCATSVARAILQERERCARIAENFLMLNTNLSVFKVAQCEKVIIRSVDK